MRTLYFWQPLKTGRLGGGPAEYRRIVEALHDTVFEGELDEYSAGVIFCELDGGPLLERLVQRREELNLDTQCLVQVDELVYALAFHISNWRSPSLPSLLRLAVHLALEMMHALGHDSSMGGKALSMILDEYPNMVRT